MPEDESSGITMVPVKRYDISLSLEEILTPLAELAGRQGALLSGPEGAQLEPHLRRLSELAGELKEVVRQINAINPALLAPRARQQPGGG
jgi:hypothetical protein